MSDIFNSMLQGQSNVVSVKKAKETPPLKSPILYSTGDNPLNTFLVDSYLYPQSLGQLKKLIESKDIQSYQILYSLQMIPSSKDENKTVWRLYKDFAWDFTKYIPPKSNIFSFGKSIFSLTRSNDLDCSLVMDDTAKEKKKDKFSRVNGFYDLLLYKTSFYHRELKSNIYPIDSWRDLINPSTQTFRNSFETWFFREQISLAKSNKVSVIKVRPIEKEIVENPNQWLIDHKSDEEVIGIDTETKYKNPWNKDSRIICITIAFKKNPYKGYYLRFKDIDTKILSEFLRGKKCIGTYLKYDFKFLELKAHIPLEHLKIYGDTVQLQQICNETMRKGLKSGAWLYTPYGGYDEELDNYKENHPECKNDYSLIPEPILSDYASKDPCVSLLVHLALEQYRDLLDLKYNSKNKYGYNLKWLYENIMIPTLNVFTDIELEGLTVDLDILEQKSKEVFDKVFSMESDILLELGEKREIFNLASPEQLGNKIKSLGWTIRSYNEKHIPNTGEEQLHEWEKDGKELATKILKYRGMSKLLTTYIGRKGHIKKNKKLEGMYNWIHDDGKIHSLYNNFGALSLRNTSSDPNGQNYPSHGLAALLVRSFLIPPSKEQGFLSLDYSALQLRIIALLSKDETMTNAFKYEKGDIHLVTAFNVFLKYFTDIKTLEEAKHLREEGEEVTKEIINDYRFKSKAINFGACFGAQATTLMTQTIKKKWKEEDCDKYIKEKSLQDLYKITLDKILKGKVRALGVSFKDEENKLNAKYLTVSIDVRENFFKTFPRIMEWIERTRRYAKTHGFVKSLYGVIRRLPYLTFNNDDGENKDINTSKFSNYLNIALNSPVQTMESVIIHRTMINMYEWIKQNKNPARLFGQIHDAIETFCPLENKAKKDFILNFFEIATKDYPEYKGIPFEVEANFSDFFNKGEFWDKGEAVKVQEL